MARYILLNYEGFEFPIDRPQFVQHMDEFVLHPADREMCMALADIADLAWVKPEGPSPYRPDGPREERMFFQWGTSRYEWGCEVGWRDDAPIYHLLPHLRTGRQDLSLGQLGSVDVPESARCPSCSQWVTVTNNGCFSSHRLGNGPCPMAGDELPARMLG